MPVIGLDNRFSVDPTSLPWKFVGRWSVDLVGGTYIGTGVLLGAEYALTAAHVYAQMWGSPAATFTPAYSYSYINGVESAPYGTVSYNNSKPSSGFNDIAIVHVNSNTAIAVKDIPGIVLFLDPADAVNKQFSSAGYPGYPEPAYDGRRMYGITGKITSAEASGHVVFSDTWDTSDGQSGSPILYSYESKVYTAGVTRGEDEDTGYPDGTIFTPEIYHNFMGLLRTTEQAINPANLPENLIIGSAGADQYIGTYRKEKVIAGEGNDTIFGSKGDDELLGGEGEDTVRYDVDPTQGGFTNLVATVQGNGAPAGSVIVTFSDSFGSTQKISEVEEVVLSHKADRVVVENDFDYADLLFDGADQVAGSGDIIDISGYDGSLYFGQADGDEAGPGTLELFTDAELTQSTGLRFKNFEVIQLGAGDDEVTSLPAGITTIMTGDGGDRFVPGHDTVGASGPITVDLGANEVGNPDRADLSLADAGLTINLGSEGVPLDGGGPKLTILNAEVIIGSTHSDTVNGSAGNDSVSGGGGDDRMLGGAGNDTLFGEDGNDFIVGGAGGDLLLGGSGADYIVADAGHDTIDGGPGNDYIDVTSTEGITYIFGRGSGHDVIASFFPGSEFFTPSHSDDHHWTDNRLNDVVKFQDLMPADLELVWDFEVVVSYDDGNDTYVRHRDGPAAIRIKDTGDTLYLDFLRVYFAHFSTVAQYEHIEYDTYLYQQEHEGDADLYSNVIDFRWLEFADGSRMSLDEVFDFENIVASSLPSEYSSALQDYSSNAGTNGPDEMNGTDGSDVILSGPGADKLFGGDGDDFIFASSGSDTIEGGSGNGNDTYDGGSGIDTVTFPSTSLGIVVDLAQGYAEGAEIGRDTLLSIEGAVGGAGQDILRGDNTTNELSGAAGDDYVDGRGGDDRLNGDDGSDTLVGGEGNDTLKGGDGSDVLAAGPGYDYLYGEGGSDRYLVNLGDQTDSIYESAGSADTDVVVFGSGIATSDVRVSFGYTSDDVRITFDNNGDSILIFGQLVPAGAIEEFWFADGTVWTAETVRQLIIAAQVTSGSDYVQGTGFGDVINAGQGYDSIFGKGGNDVLDGGADGDFLEGGDGSDTYVYRAGDGSDYIYDYSTSSDDVDILRFIDLSQGDITLSRSDLDVILTVNSTGDTIVLGQLFTSMTPSSGVDRIEFGDGSAVDRAHILGAAWIRGTSGDETLNGTSDNDMFFGDLGNDTFSSGAGSDTYIYRSGDGNDYINDESGSTTDIDTLRFTNLNASDLTFTRSGVHLVIKVNATGQTVTIDEQYFSQTANWGIEKIEFADGTSWSLGQIIAAGWYRGTTGNETISGSSWNDTFFGDLGNDTFSSGAGSDTYVYRSGDGNDYINDESGSTTDVDTLKLTNLNAGDLTFSRSGVNLVIKLNATGQTITIDEQYYSQTANWGIEKIEFADGTSWNLGQITAAGWYRGTTGADTMNGSAWNETYLGDLGNDTFSGVAGSDTYIYRSGDGNDVIDDESGSTSEIDVLKLTDLNASDILLTRSGQHLLVDVAATGQHIEIRYQFYSQTANWGVEKFEFADGSSWNLATINANAWTRGTTGADTMNGSAWNETYLGGLGNDTFSGVAGSDTYIYRSGDGNDVIDDESGSTSEVDVLKFTDLNASDISLTRNGQHLMVDVAATGQHIEIRYQFYSQTANWGVEKFEFTDGTSWNLATINANAWTRGTSGNDSISGTAWDDHIDGGAGNDILTGSTGADTLVGGANNDTLTGGTGNDSFLFRAGFGQDIITDFTAGAGSDDAIDFYDGIFADYAAVIAAASTSGSNTIITVDASNTITLTGVALASLHQDDFRFH